MFGHLVGVFPLERTRGYPHWKIQAVLPRLSFFFSGNSMGSERYYAIWASLC